jgi:Rha family phage regulatory protein
MTDTLTVAKSCRKRHGDVLRAYDNLHCSPEFDRRNFAPVEYLDQKGELRRMIKMTKDGFMMQVMGFPSEAATIFKDSGRWRHPDCRRHRPLLLRWHRS